MFTLSCLRVNGLQRKTQISPGAGFFGRVAQEVGGAVGDDHRDGLGGDLTIGLLLELVMVHTAAQFAQGQGSQLGLLRLQQGQRGAAAQGDDHAWLHQGNLALQVGQTLRQLGGLRVARGGRAAFDDLGDEDVGIGALTRTVCRRAAQAHSAQHVVQQLALTAAEGLATGVVFIAGCLAHDQPARTRAAHSRHCPLAAPAQAAGGAGGYRFIECGPAHGGNAAGELADGCGACCGTDGCCGCGR